MSHHSTDSELRYLWLGRLPPAQADRIRLHLSRCEECLSRLIEIDAHLADAEAPEDSAEESHPALLAR
jgi:anti-sigma factor RsiW